MRLPRCVSTGAGVLSLLAWTRLATAHSWVERTMRIAPNGTMVGTPGYERAHVVRGTESEDDIVWLMPPNGRSDGKVVHQDDKIVKPSQESLTGSSYTSSFPMLQVAPGDFVALQYQENGHVTLPDINPTKTLNRGTVYVYGTTDNDLSNANLADIHYSWTADGTGGNGKGRLLATRNFDDGQCYQINGNSLSQYRQSAFSKPSADPMGQNLWCQTDVQIPANLTAGQVYTMIWLWDWPTMNAENVPVPPVGWSSNSTSLATYVTEWQFYSSVADFQIVDPCDKSLGSVKGAGCKKSGGKNVVEFVAQAKNLNLGAVQDQLQTAFLVDVPQAGNGATEAIEAPTDIPGATSVTGLPSAGTPAATTTSQPQQTGIVTVTKTVAAVTVTTTVTVDADTATQVASSQSQTVLSTAPTPTHFMLRPRKVRRGAGEWSFGH